MKRVASLYLPQLPIERLRRLERPRALPEPAASLPLPINDDPGACSVPRGGGWRPGARWARGDQSHAEAVRPALPRHQQPSMRELGRRTEAAAHPFRAMRPDEGGAAISLQPSLEPPHLAPTILVSMSGQREIVTAVCPTAHALGLSPGMAATQARALVTYLDVRPADPDGDAESLERLALHAARFWTPTAAVAGPDGLWLDLTGTTHLFGGEARFCRHLCCFMARLGFTAHVAIAGTLGAAHALARFGKSAITILPPGQKAEAIASLPLAALRLDEDALATAARFGLERVADLLPLPRGPIARRLGRGTILRLDQALGRVREPIRPVIPTNAPSAERRLLEPIGTAESISVVISDLARDLVERLIKRGAGARALTLALLRVDGSEQHVVIGTAAATRSAEHLTRLLGLRIDRIDPGMGIEAMRLTAIRVETLGPQSPKALIGTDEQSSDLAPLVDQLAARVGEDRLFRAAAVESDVPERTVAKAPPLSKPSGWPSWRRPARLLRHPEPLDNVVALLPDHPPRRFRWRGKVHQVVAGDGPERIHGEWWRREGETLAVRDYYQIEDESGGRYWIFRRGDGIDSRTGDMSWHLHGVFG